MQSTLNNVTVYYANVTGGMQNTYIFLVTCKIIWYVNISGGMQYTFSVH